MWIIPELWRDCISLFRAWYLKLLQNCLCFIIVQCVSACVFLCVCEKASAPLHVCMTVWVILSLSPRYFSENVFTQINTAVYFDLKCQKMVPREQMSFRPFNWDLTCRVIFLYILCFCRKTAISIQVTGRRQGQRRYRRERWRAGWGLGAFEGCTGTSLALFVVVKGAAETWW